MNHTNPQESTKNLSENHEECLPRAGTASIDDSVRIGSKDPDTNNFRDVNAVRQGCHEVHPGKPRSNSWTGIKKSRRWLLGATGAGVGLLVGRSLPAIAQLPETTRILKHGDKIDLEGKAEEIIQKAYELGYEYEKQHGGCARCTVAALQDAIPFVAVDESLFRGSTCLDGGATPTGTQNCGAFTGLGMVIGHVCGSTRRETFEGDAKLAHQLIHKVYDRFKEEYGTVLCEDVRKGAERDCPEVVGRAAKWVAEVLLGEFTDYTPVEQPDKEHAADKTSETAEE